MKALILAASMAVLAGSPPSATVTFLFNETFEGTGAPASWAGSGTADFDYTAAPLNGSQSLLLPTGNYAVCNLAAPQAELWWKFRFRLPTLPAVGDEILYVEDASFTNNFKVAVVSTGVVEIDCGGGGGFGASSGSIAAATTYFGWAHTKKGTGANAQLEFAWSTTNTKPTSGANFVSVTGGTTTTDVDHFQMRALGSNNLIIDDVQISTTAFE